MEITTEQGAAGWLTACSAGIENGEVVEAVGSSVEQLERLSMDDMLQLWVGEFGRAQLRHFVLVSLAWSIEGLQSLVMIFADRQPSWQCRPHTNASGASNESWCTPSASICDMDPSAWEWVGGPGISTVSEWGLICGHDYKIGLAQSAFFIGGLLGAGLFGSLSDSMLGRKGALFCACAMTALAGLSTSQTPNYIVYVILRAFTGLSCGGVGLSCFVLATEPVGPSKRGQVGMSAFYFFSFGIMVLPVFAYFTHYWRLLYVATSIPAVLYCVLVLPFIWESPRWYLVQGRVKEAMHVLRTLAKQNGKYVPHGVSLEANDGVNGRAIEGTDEVPQLEYIDQNSQLKDSEEMLIMSQKASGTLLDVFQSPTLRLRMLIMIVIWFNCGTVYYGISLNVVNLGFNLYLSVFFNALVEMPAFMITALLLERLGRRFMLVSAMLLSGVCCLIGSMLAVAKGMKDVARVLCSLLGIFGMAATYNLIYIYTAELFPTVIRNAALGLTTQMGGIGAIIAPGIVVLGHLNASLPLAIFGAVAVMGGLLAIWLPETLNQPLYETLEGLERGEVAI
ncbi:unnamed protein product [Sphagnum jensenii]|uniref:Major facilitator superfamily (MFS) profile domain-containing protein n=1 Tax=Sphagnum jensenii TaxID=128206 RepID=A0ABP1AUL7_9BRYO